MNQELLLKNYSLTEKDLFLLYEKIVKFLRDKSVSISYISLEPIIETDVYRLARALEHADAHHETCLSDGKNVWLHEDLEEVGGIISRVYDILHVGCGHLWQWSADSSSGLEFYGNRAWRIGSQFHLGASEHTLNIVRRYEREAGLICLQNLKNILAHASLGQSIDFRCIQLYTDYLATDLDYIITYYRTGKIQNFFDNWQSNTAPLESIDVTFPTIIRQRRNQCTALINVR